MIDNSNNLRKIFNIFRFDNSQGIRHPDLNICLIFFGFTVSCLNLFLYCHFGQRTTDEYAAIADNLFESDWFKSPVEIQKYFTMMISNAQRPLTYNGFSLVYLDLETFLKVNRAHQLNFKTVIELLPVWSITAFENGY